MRKTVFTLMGCLVFLMGFNSALAAGPMAVTGIFTTSTQSFGEIDFSVYDSLCGDVDGDGDLDAIFAGAGGTASFRVYLNDGTGSLADSGQSHGGGTGHDLLLRDFDNDGDLDVVVMIDSELKLYVNNASGIFSDHGPGPNTTDTNMLAAGDLDNDGDVDVVAATDTGNNPHYFLNDGAGNFSDGGSLSTLNSAEPAVADVNGDSALDIGTAGLGLPTIIYTNNGSGSFPTNQSLFGNFHTRGGVYFADMDGDGFPDLFEANDLGVASRLFLNDGSGTFTDSAYTFGGNLTFLTKVAFGDIDSDGDFDLLAAATTAPEAYYLNDGSGQLQQGDALFEAEHISLADVDDDGDLDALSGKVGGVHALFLNQTSPVDANTAPTWPIGLQFTRSGNTYTFSWLSGSDIETPDPLLRYNLRVGTTPGANDIFSGVMPAGETNVGQGLAWTLHNLSAPIYYWGVQCVDSGQRPSAWNTAQTGNNKPIGGYASEFELPATQISQSISGDGLVTIPFRIKDGESQSVTLSNFLYSVDGGTTWNAPSNGDNSGCLNSGWRDNAGARYSSATDWSGPVHSISLDTQHDDLTGLDGLDQSDVRIRFRVNDGFEDSDTPVTSENFQVDNRVPAGAIQINSGATHCNAGAVDLTLVPDDAVSMALQNESEVIGSWETPSTSKVWILSSGEGTKTVSVLYKDSFGNVGQFSAQIIRDELPPPAPTVIGPDESDENEPTLDWENDPDAHTFTVEYSVTPDFATATSVTNLRASELTVATPLGDGDWYWRVQATDAAGNSGNWSATGQVTVNTSGYCANDPDQPALLGPADGASNVTLTPTLTASAFSDTNNCTTHWKSRWQVSEDPLFQDLTANINAVGKALTGWQVPPAALKPGTIYYWRVRYWGESGNKSPWSPTYMLTTRAASVDDSNANDIPDSHEVDITDDLDQDGTVDYLQTDRIKSIRAVTGDIKFGICPLQSGLIKRTEAVDDASLAETGVLPEIIPHGMIAYRLLAPNYGDTVEVKIYFDKPVPTYMRWANYDTLDGWQDFSEHVEFNAARDIVTLYLKDGGFGDNDRTENGVIVDPSGPAVFEISEDVGGACFIYTGRISVFKR